MPLPSTPRTAQSAPQRNHELTPGSVVLGRYTIQRVLGRGGMATVYLALHQQTERLVALKMLDPQLCREPSYVERFRREARAAGRVRSDNVVATYDFDAEVGGTLVLVMEYLEGQTVQQALRGGRLPVSKVFTMGRHLLEGLAAAHAAGVIHRDLKPGNLFIEKSSSGTEKLKILDFGISKMADGMGEQELTRAGQTLGTVAYMAPEQIRGKVAPGDARVDLYAAGVCLFLMLTGRRPIDAEDTVQLLAAVLEKEPLTLSQAAGEPFPAALEAFVARAMRKDPNDRFQSAIEMRDALSDIGRSLGFEPPVGGALESAGAAGTQRLIDRPALATIPPGVDASGLQPLGSAAAGSTTAPVTAIARPSPGAFGLSTAQNQRLVLLFSTVGALSLVAAAAVLLLRPPPSTAAVQPQVSAAALPTGPAIPVVAPAVAPQNTATAPTPNVVEPTVAAQNPAVVPTGAEVPAAEAPTQVADAGTPASAVAAVAATEEDEADEPRVVRTPRSTPRTRPSPRSSTEGGSTRITINHPTTTPTPSSTTTRREGSSRPPRRTGASTTGRIVEDAPF